MMESGMGDIEGIYWLGIAFLAFWLAVMIFLLKPLFSGEYTNLSGDDLVYTRLMPEEPFRVASRSNTPRPSSPAKILERTKTMKARRKSLYNSQEQLMCRRWLAQQASILGTLNSEDEQSDDNPNDACTTLPAITVIGSTPVQSFDDASPSDATTTNYDVQVEVHTAPGNADIFNRGRNPNMSLLTLPQHRYSRLPSSATWCCTPRSEQLATTRDVDIPKLNLSYLDEPVQSQITSPDFETATEHSHTNDGSFVTARSHFDSKQSTNPQSSTRLTSSGTCREKIPLLKRQSSLQTRHNHQHHKPKSKSTVVAPLQDDHVEFSTQAEQPNRTEAEPRAVSPQKHTAVTQL